MKAKEIIEQLQKMDPEADVLVAVKTYTKIFPQAYVSPFQVEVGSQRIYVSLPEGMAIKKRKVAA